jgi:hypothetical protein
VQATTHPSWRSVGFGQSAAIAVAAISGARTITNASVLIRIVILRLIGLNFRQIDPNVTTSDPGRCT